MNFNRRKLIHQEHTHLNLLGISSKMNMATEKKICQSAIAGRGKPFKGVAKFAVTSSALTACHLKSPKGPPAKPKFVVLIVLENLTCALNASTPKIAILQAPTLWSDFNRQLPKYALND